MEYVCPVGHAEKFLKVDSYLEVVYCSRCGDLNSYELSDLRTQPLNVPGKYHLINPSKLPTGLLWGERI
jgi:hypothetical protein